MWNAEPEAVLNVRNQSQRDYSSLEVLVQWKDLPEWEATLEDFNATNLRFPHFHLEDKMVVWVGGNAGTSHKTTPVLMTYSRKGGKGKRVILKKDRGN